MPKDRVDHARRSLDWRSDDPQNASQPSRQPAPRHSAMMCQEGPLSHLPRPGTTPLRNHRSAALTSNAQPPIATARWQDPYPSAWGTPAPEYLQASSDFGGGFPAIPYEQRAGFTAHSTDRRAANPSQHYPGRHAPGSYSAPYERDAGQSPVTATDTSVSGGPETAWSGSASAHAGDLRHHSTAAMLREVTRRHNPQDFTDDHPLPSGVSLPSQTLSSDPALHGSSVAGSHRHEPEQGAPGQRGRITASRRHAGRPSIFSPEPAPASILAMHAEYIDAIHARAPRTEHTPAQPAASTLDTNVSAPRPRAAYQSSVNGVSWIGTEQRWRVRHKDRTLAYFSVSKYGSIEAAQRAAEQDAPGLLAGTLVPTPRRAAYRSSVKGVFWHEGQKKWQVNDKDSDGKLTYWTFPVSRYGSVEEAQRAAEEAALRLRGGQPSGMEASGTLNLA